MTGAPSWGGGARDDRPAPVLLWDGTLVVPGVLSEELTVALDRLEAYEKGVVPPSSRRSGGLPPGAWAVREVSRQAAVQFREQQEAQRSNAAVSAPVVTVVTPAQARSESVSEITTEQAATILRVSSTRVRQLALDGTIEGRKTSRNVWLLDPRSVRAYRARRGTRHGDDDDGTKHQAAARGRAA